MINVMTKTRQKVVALAVAGFAAAALGLAATATPAYASDTPWNPAVQVTAYADNPSFQESEQYVDVTMTFSQAVPASVSSVMENYLQENITIAGRTIASDDGDSYARDVQDVVVSGNTVTFTLAPNSQGTTANYSGELYIAANASDNAIIASRMGNAPVETLIDNGINFTKVSGTQSAATFTVDTRAQARAMNHILITDVIDGKETAIFDSATGAFSNGGITVHSHAFVSLQTTDYAATLVSVANGTTQKVGCDYEFVYNEGTNQFTIINNNGSSENIQVYLYACDYLNANELSVGEISEPEWSVTHPED